MTEVVWRSIKDDLPITSDNYWVCNYEDVNVLYSSEFNNSEYLFWAEMEYPEVPKKKDHSCGRASDFGVFFCTEINGKLFLTHDSGLIDVEYCPFCGYSPKDKE